MANEDRISRLSGSVLSLAACLVLAGCSSAAPTPIVVFVTPTPQITPIIIYVTQAPMRTAAATDRPLATATATASPTPTASPISGAATCTGNASNKAFFVEAASKEPFDVYCAVLPSSWWLEQGEYTLPGGGKVTVQYKNAAGAAIIIIEGAWCTTTPAACSPHTSTIGPASFGGLSGTAYIYAGGATRVIYVNPGTDHAYAFFGDGMTQAQFVAYAAAVVKVPRS